MARPTLFMGQAGMTRKHGSCMGPHSDPTRHMPSMAWWPGCGEGEEEGRAGARGRCDSDGVKPVLRWRRPRRDWRGGGRGRRGDGGEEGHGGRIGNGGPWGRREDGEDNAKMIASEVTPARRRRGQCWIVVATRGDRGGVAAVHCSTAALGKKRAQGGETA